MIQLLPIAYFHLRPLTRGVFLAIGLMTLTSLLDGFGLGILMPILQEMQDSTGQPGSDMFSRYTEVVLSAVGLGYSFQNLILLFSVVMLVKFGLQAGTEYQSRYLSATLKHRLRTQALRNLLQYPMPFFHRKSTGELIATVHTSSDYGGSIAEYLTTLLTCILTMGLYICLLLAISPALSLVSFIWILLSYKFIIPRFRATSWKGEAQKELTDQMVSHLHETIGGIRVVKAFTQEEKHGQDFEAMSGKFRLAALRLMVDKVVASLFMEPYSTLLIIVLMVISVMALDLEFSALLTFFVVFARLAPRFKQVNALYLQVLEYRPHLHKVHEVIVTQVPKSRSETPLPVPDRIGDLTFDDVWFHYENRSDFVLSGMSMTIQGNMCTALVGSSGAGKTTIVDLILRNLAPVRGTIRADGKDLQSFSRAEWLGRIGLVEQEPFLFRASIRENILYGKPDATHEEVEAAARLANAHDFIAALPRGYETVVGDRGAMISVGQKQRVTLARALIRDPAILILDEATSSQDAVSERLIQEAIERLERRKTIIVIAHRFSSIVNADWIVFLENGRVVEVGNHHDLVGKDGPYARNFRLQTANFGGK